MVRSLTLLNGMALALILGGVAWAETHLQYPHPCPNACPPNVGNFGYFPTTWRQWPGEVRMEQINPRAINSEVLPTPEGREQVPLPRGTSRPQPQPPSAVPEGEMLPPGGSILPPQVPGFPTETPAPPKSERPSRRPAEGGLPGLLNEPTPGPSENKQPNEQPKPESPTTDRSLPGSWRQSLERPVTVATASDAREVQRGATVLLAGGQEPADSPVSPGSHRAHAISAALPESPNGGFVVVESAAPARSDSANALPSVALNGYCPVALLRSGRWTQGNVRWTVVHNGWIYRLSGPTERQQFLADPDAFAPAHSGTDPVLAVDARRTVPGQPAYCAAYNGRLYMFSSPATQTQFNQSPQRYAAGK